MRWNLVSELPNRRKPIRSFSLLVRLFTKQYVSCYRKPEDKLPKFPFVCPAPGPPVDCLFYFPSRLVWSLIPPQRAVFIVFTAFSGSV